MIYLDALVVKVRDGVARDEQGRSHRRRGRYGRRQARPGDLDPDHEGAKFWAGVCADLANRGVRDVLIVCCDGLTGLPEAIEATWRQATVQTCVVHLIRAAMRFVNYKDRKAVAKALKPIYTAVDADAARAEFETFKAQRVGQEVPPRGRDLGSRLGALHPVPGLPARAAPGHLHHQRDRVAELPAAQGHQEPRPVPQRHSP